MPHFARTAAGRILCAYLTFMMLVPGALAQHAAKAIQNAARDAGILLDDEFEYDAKLKTLVLAFDPSSPLDALQKFISLAKAAPIGANGVGQITVDQMCRFYQSLKSDPAFINHRDWRVFQASHGRFIDYLLYDGNSGCGAGPIKNIVLQNRPDGRYVWINLNNEINYRFQQGTYATRSKTLIYRISDKPEHASRLLQDFAKTGTNFNTLFKNISPNRVLQNQDAQEVATGITHVKEGAENFDQAKVLRTLETYDTLAIQPYDRNSYLLYRPQGYGNRQMEIGAFALMSPHAIADRGHGDSARPFEKGILVARSYEDNGRHAIDGRIGQVSMPPTLNNVAPEWKPVVEGTLESVNTLMDNHFNAIQNTGIGMLYGPKSDFAKMTQQQKDAFLSRTRRPGTAPPVPQETSCVGFVLDQLEVGYKNAGKEERWREIDRIVRENKGDGNFLLQELKKDGWTTIYFNPDTRNPTSQVASPSKERDHHIWTHSEVNRGNNYLSGVRLFNGERFSGIPIDKKMLDYRPTNPLQTTTQTQELMKLREAPMFVGIANGGYHVYLGAQGNVIESHSTRGPTDPTNIEIRPFSEWGLLQGESYLSGVIAVPPGSWRE